MGRHRLPGGRRRAALVPGAPVPQAYAPLAGGPVAPLAGSVAARRVGGRVRLASSAGDMTGEELTATAVDATSAAGSVVLDLARPPARVLAESSAGDVRVLLPDAAYAVHVETSAGEEDVTVRQDPAGDRTVRVRSSAGDVVVAPR